MRNVLKALTITVRGRGVSSVSSPVTQTPASVSTATVTPPSPVVSSVYSRLGKMISVVPFLDHLVSGPKHLTEGAVPLSLPVTATNAIQAEIRKPGNSSSNSERRQRRSNSSPKKSPERNMISPSLPPPLSTCKKEVKDNPKDSEAKKEPSPTPTIYSRFKNVVTEAIQKIWNIFL